MATKKQPKKAEKAAEKSAVIFIKPWVYVQNLGDGSCGVRFFNERAEAEAYAEPDDERNCDDVFQVTLVVDPKTGRVCNVRKRQEDD